MATITTDCFKCGSISLPSRAMRITLIYESDSFCWDRAYYELRCPFCSECYSWPASDDLAKYLIEAGAQVAYIHLPNDDIQSPLPLDEIPRFSIADLLMLRASLQNDTFTQLWLPRWHNAWDDEDLTDIF